MSTYNTPFLPESHGFTWPNSFDGEDIVNSWFDQKLMTTGSVGQILGRIDQGSSLQLAAGSFGDQTDRLLAELSGLVDAGGLSAGMCLTALDRYHEDRSPWKGKPGRRSKKFAQMARYQFGVFARTSRIGEIVSDMSRPDAAHGWSGLRSLGDLSAHEWWPRIRSRLKDGTPVPLILYRARWNPFANDVVIATGYRESRQGDLVRLHVYDPNRPGDATHMDIDFAGENWFRMGPKSVYSPRFRKVRGFRRVRHQIADTDRASPEMLAHLAAV